jgi:hypothetical protein
MYLISLHRFARLLPLERIQAANAALIVSLVFIIGAALLHFYRTEPMQAQAAQLRQEIAAARNNAVGMGLNPLPNDIPAEETHLTRFYRHFPLRENAQASLAVIFSAAEAQGLLLAEGSYQMIPVKDLKLFAYQISLPLKGSYKQIRKYVAQVLKAMPAASLDELSFSREAITHEQVDAKIRLTLYLKSNDEDQ